MSTAARAHRTSGFWLTVAAVVVTVAAYALVALGRRGRLPVNLALYGSVFAVGYLAAHLAIRRLAPRADPALFPTAGLLAGLAAGSFYFLAGEPVIQQALRYEVVPAGAHSVEVF